MLWKGAVSFDALNTLIGLRGSCGALYRARYGNFLAQHGVLIGRDMPDATAENMNRIALRAMQAQLDESRVAWHAQHPDRDPKEMPFGGATPSSVRHFWTGVLNRVYRDPVLYRGAPQPVRDVVSALQSTPALWQSEFLDHVIFHDFASTSCHAWRDEGLRTLRCLRRWNASQWDKWQSVREKHDSADNSRLGVLVLATEPFVLSNMDYRLREVMRQLLADEGESGVGACTVDTNSSHVLSGVPDEPDQAISTGRRRSSSSAPTPPLLGSVIVAADVGLAKPSPMGLYACARAAGIEQHINRLVHVGDSDVDERACALAGCRFVRCEGQTGVRWEELLGELEAVQSSLRNMSCS